MNEVKKYKVTVADHTFTLMSDESEGHLLQVSHMVNGLIKDFEQKNQGTDAKKVAILTALNIASNLLKVQGQIERQQRKIKHIIDFIEHEINTLCSGR